MKNTKLLIIMLCIVLILTILMVPTHTQAAEYTDSQKNWLAANKGKTLVFGMPLKGDSVVHEKSTSYNSFVYSLTNEICKRLGVKAEYKMGNMDDLLTQLNEGKIDILFSLKATDDRKKIMSFSDSILSIPYAVYKKEGTGEVFLSDFSGKNIGFVKGDDIIHLFPAKYPDIKYNAIIYDDVYTLNKALRNGDIDYIVYENSYGYIYDILENSGIEKAFKISTINSDLNYVTKKQSEVIIDLFNNEMNKMKADGSFWQIVNVEYLKFRQVLLKLTDEEKNYLKENKKIGVVLNPYEIPLSYYDNNKFYGSEKAILDEVGTLLDVKFDYIASSDDSNLNILNEPGVFLTSGIFKTYDVDKSLSFSNAYLNDRLLIYGTVGDGNVGIGQIHNFYDLEGQKVMVLKGSGQKEQLNKISPHIEVVEIDSSLDILKKLNSGEYQYGILSQAVADYAIVRFEYNNVIRKSDLYLNSDYFFSAKKENALLISSINKALALMDKNDLYESGVKAIPLVKDKYEKQLRTSYYYLYGALALIFIAIIFALREAKIVKYKQELLYMDNLTKMANRPAVFKAINQSIAKKEHCAVILLDLDYFKQINDTYGHSIGDTVLIEVANRLKKVSKAYPNTTPARIGGDEFMIHVPNITREQAEELCKTLLAKINETFEITSDISFNFSFSIGVSFYPENAATSDSLYVTADEAMYHSKKDLGKNAYTIYSK